ncbi:lactate racemase domain-containing protein [Limnoglobus roseus]|uniref:LarA-like N-terminal domain-containing protein n=1 Tax=Limnoglobus roseus TaxID=2598579 RepID=A0A5C1AHK7_9BACT|nr:lactate racemase domain-containing protein [Limnoglobus roseus]QEL18115.1 hypothetical protein PX52LOC_05129 [Limnoglobus roseus]
MSLPIEIAFGTETWHLELPAEKRVTAHRAGCVASTASAAEQVRAALEKPFDFEPLRRALTPDDHVVVVVDESLPALAEIVTAVLQHLGTAGVTPEAVTLLTPPKSVGGNWLDDLPDEFADVRTEVHDPADRKKLAYLATSKGGRRLYLNRTLVEAEFTVVVSGRRYDPHHGYAGGESLLFPTLSDDETRTAFQGDAAKESRGEPAEAAYLLGTPFFVQIIEDGDRVLDVVAGLPTSTAEGIRRQDEFWGVRIDEKPDTVITFVDGRATFAEMALAVHHASRAVARGGKVAVLAPPVDLVGEGLTLLRHCVDPREALKFVSQAKPADATACRQWATAASRAKLYVANVADDTAEELFSTRVGNERELQRLVETSERVLILPNGHRSRVELSSESPE